MDVSAAVMLLMLPVCPQIRYWRQHEREAAADRVRTAGLETTARVSGLRPSTRYHVAVLAYNSAGTGPPSPRTTVTTRKPRTATVITHAHHVVVVSFSCIRTLVVAVPTADIKHHVMISLHVILFRIQTVTSVTSVLSLCQLSARSRFIYLPCTQTQSSSGESCMIIRVQNQVRCPSPEEPTNDQHTCGSVINTFSNTAPYQCSNKTFAIKRYLEPS